MLWVFGLMSLFLWGCAGLPWGGPEATSRNGAPQVAKWELEGRIGVRSSKDSWQASLHWSHDARQDRLRLSGPFNQGLVSIVVQDDLILINEGEGVSQIARDPEVYLKERLGFGVPLRSLRYWVLGVPDPSKPWQSVVSNPGVAGGFDQGGWRVEPRDALAGAGAAVPARLDVEGYGVRLKIIIDQWQPA